MKLYKIIMIAFVMVMVSPVLLGQQDVQFTQYLYNTMSINPGYAGSLDRLDIVGIYRDQWVGIDGAPVTQNLGIHAPLRNDQIGLGLNLVNDEIGPANEFIADANFSYKIQLSPTLRLGLGVKAGVNLFNVDFSKGDFQNPDPVLNNNIENRFTLNLGAGAFLYSENWYLGLSVPDFITDDFYDDVDQSVSKEELQYYLIGGYVFDLNNDFKLKPTFLLKYLDGFPLVVDISGNVLYKERFTLGVAYRYDDAISGLVGFQVLESLFIGYSYDYTLTDLSNYNDGTHEVILRFMLPSRNKTINSPRFF